MKKSNPHTVVIGISTAIMENNAKNLTKEPKTKSNIWSSDPTSGNAAKENEASLSKSQ